MEMQTQNPLTEDARRHIAKMNLMLQERLKCELSKPGMWGRVKLEVTIQNGQIGLFEVSSQETIRIKPL